MEVFIYAGLFLVLVALILSGKLRSLVQGFLSLFVEDIAKTPEGAEAVYTKAIEEAESDYIKADDTYRRVAGQLNSAKTSKEQAVAEIASLDNKIKALLGQGREADAVLLAEKREGVLAEIDLFSKQIAKLETVFKDAQMIHTNMQKQLENLKKDRKTVVTQLKMNQQMEQVYDSMDSFKNVKHTDKLVSAIKEKVVDGNDAVAGAKMVHENKLSTRMESIDEVSKKASALSYVEGLKTKK